MKASSLSGLLTVALVALAGAPPVPGQTHAESLIATARSAIEQAWKKEVQRNTESALARVEVHAVQRRDRLAPGREIHLVRALAEASWWPDSRHYLLLLGPPASGFEVLYRFDGGIGGKGVDVRLIDLGSGAPRFALEISDHGFEGETTGAWTVLALHLPETDRFAEVFRELTTWRPASSRGYAGSLAYRQADGPMKEIAVATELLEDGKTVERIESIFSWTGSVYEGTIPLPEAWRAELPPRAKLGLSSTPPPARRSPTPAPRAWCRRGAGRATADRRPATRSMPRPPRRSRRRRRRTAAR